jgi:uncharacterized membrane protein
MTIIDPTPRLERLLASLLQVGTAIASIVIGLGLLFDLVGARAGFAVPGTGSDLDLVTVGVAGFILLPVLRVVAMLIAYLYDRDLLLSAISAAVLAIIAAGLIAGR